MTLKVSSAVLLLAALAVAPAWAAEDTFTIQRLHDFCAAEDSVRAATCIGYLIGVADIMHFVATMPQPLEDEKEIHAAAVVKVFINVAGICTDKYTGGQLRQVFLNWAKNHPERWLESRAYGAIEAFREAFPCPLK